MEKIFNNKFNVKDIYLSVSILLFVVINTELIGFIIDLIAHNSFSMHWDIVVIIEIITLVGIIISLISINKNTYRIYNDKLQIKEYQFFTEVNNLSIPLKMIKEVRIERTFNYARPHIALYLPSGTLRLNCTTHRQELYNEIYNYISNSKTEEDL